MSHHHVYNLEDFQELAQVRDQGMRSFAPLEGASLLIRVTGCLASDAGTSKPQESSTSLPRIQGELIKDLEMSSTLVRELYARSYSWF